MKNLAMLLLVQLGILLFPLLRGFFHAILTFLGFLFHVVVIAGAILAILYAFKLLQVIAEP